MVTVQDVLTAGRGHVVAPAGCGKTELISQCIGVRRPKPYLVLTHTTAGVAALQSRLKRAGIPPTNYRLNTIAGWATNLISMFPERSGLAVARNSPPNYPQIQTAAGNLCVGGHITDLLRATYDRILVDEYQDCSNSQHALICGLAQSLPTVVFGDPMQAIFGFSANDTLPDWNRSVVADFPFVGELTEPWRWNNVGSEALGAWLLAARLELLAGRQIDLRTGPRELVWHSLTNDGGANIAIQLALHNQLANGNADQSLLVIGDSVNAASRHNFASRAFGVHVVEPVEMSDLISMAGRMSGTSGPELLTAGIDFLGSVMTNVGASTLRNRVQILTNGRPRNPATVEENAAVAVHEGGGYSALLNFFHQMAASNERRIYRRSAFNFLFEGIKLANGNPALDLNVHIAALREKYRHAGRIAPHRAVGSTLLLKGLEADHGLVLDADAPGRRMSAAHLYVALSRGRRSVHVFARNPILP